VWCDRNSQYGRAACALLDAGLLPAASVNVVRQRWKGDRLVGGVVTEWSVAFQAALSGCTCIGAERLQTGGQQ
jgi:hypothetical protein